MTDLQLEDGKVDVEVVGALVKLRVADCTRGSVWPKEGFK